MQTVGEREVRKTASGKKLTVVEMGLNTYYYFRGPRSHRPVQVTVRHPFYARFREEQALDKVNGRWKWHNENEFRRIMFNDERFFQRTRRR